MIKKLYILLATTVLFFAVVMFFGSGTVGTQTLWNVSNQGTWLLPLVGVSAAIDSVNPCAFSILLITIAFLFSLNAARKRILTVGGAYIFGIFLVYLLIGLGILQTLHIFNTPHFMAKVGATALIVFGAINLINEFFPSFPIKLKIPNTAHQKIADLMERSSIPAAMGLGILVGLCEFPCTGGPYLMVLGLLHDSATFLKGFGYLLLYNVIFILPLALILLIGSHRSVLEKLQTWKRTNLRTVKVASGCIMVGLGIGIFLL